MIEWRRTGDEGIKYPCDVCPRRGGGEGVVRCQKISHEGRLKVKKRLNKELGGCGQDQEQETMQRINERPDDAEVQEGTYITLRKHNLLHSS